MLTSLRAAAVCEIHEVNPIGVDNGEGSGAALGVRTRIRGVVAKLDHVTDVPER